MAARRPFWKWHCWKSIGFCLWPPSTCIWNLKLKFQSKLELCSGNHVVYRQTDGRTDGQTDGRRDGQGESSIPPSNFVGQGYNKIVLLKIFLMSLALIARSHIANYEIDGLVQDKCNSIALVMELYLTFPDPSISTASLELALIQYKDVILPVKEIPFGR